LDIGTPKVLGIAITITHVLHANVGALDLASRSWFDIAAANVYP
jgi:hypothetical protein